jgi:hypothetical protein
MSAARRPIGVAAASLGLLIVSAGGSAAAVGARHEFQPEHYDAAEHFAAGEGFCVSWAGTFHEVRNGGYRLVYPPGGQLDGEFHVNGVINGLVRLIPDDHSLPTYSGTYREKSNAVVTSWDATPRVAQARLRSTLVGTDGSSYQIVITDKITLNASGDTVVSRDTFTCT